MARKIRFTTNWNNKLDCDIFTTIRPLSNYYQFDTLYDIQLQGKSYCKAQIKVMKRGKLPSDNLEEANQWFEAHELMLDTGRVQDRDIDAIFEAFYGKKKARQQEYLLLVLEKVKSK